MTKTYVFLMGSFEITIKYVSTNEDLSDLDCLKEITKELEREVIRRESSSKHNSNW